MISHLHNRKNRTARKLIPNRSPGNMTKKGDKNRLSNTTDNPSYHTEMERISIVEDSGRPLKNTFGTRRSSMSHLTEEEPVLDEVKIQELLDLVRGYCNNC